MSEPRRLLSDPEASPFERDLLESWSAEQPSNAARLRALSIAGVAVTAVAATSTATAAAAGAGSIAPKAMAVGGAALFKWSLVGALVVAAGAGTIALATRSPDAPAVVSAAAATPSVTATNAATNAAPPPTGELPTISPDDLPAAAAAAPSASPSNLAPAHPRSTASASPARDASLADEIALFDRARASLAAGDANRALALVDEYEGRFRSGAFVQEAEVLRVQALVRKGDRAGANRVAERFLAAHPTSPHAARLRAILGSSSP